MIKGLLKLVFLVCLILAPPLAQAQTIRLAPRALAPNWTSLPPATLTMPGVSAGGWATNCAEPLPPGNMQVAANMPTAWKFVVRQGDIPPGDLGRIPARSRCEWSASAMKSAYGVVIYQAVSLRIGCFPVTSGRQLYFGQWHASDDDADVAASHPIWAIRQDTATRLRVTYSGSINDNSTIVDSTAFTDNAFTCGAWYDWLFQSTFSKTGAGDLLIWRRKAGQTAFTQVANLHGVNMGYNDVAGPYWKWGYYGYDDAATVTVEYANQIFPGTSDLTYLLTCGTCWSHPL